MLNLGRLLLTNVLRAVFIGNGVNILLQEVELDGNYIRFALCSVIPLFFCVSLVRCAGH